MGDLRCIALCNVVYKIIVKVMANHLKLLLDSIIVENQSAFVPERLMTDNIMIAFEIQHCLKCKTQGKDGYAAMKLDMSKAYDHIEWPLLRAIMLKLGFCVRWMNLIWACISSVEYHILHEGGEIGPIIPHRGLW